MVGKKILIIAIVAILVIAAIGAALLLMGGGDDEEQATNYFDKGFKLELYYNQGNSARETACNIMKQNLEAINPGKIAITVTQVEWSQYLELRKTGAMPAFFLGWAPDYADPHDYVQPFYISGGTYCRMIGYANTTLDDKIMAAAAELDPDTRADMYLDITTDMYNECLYIWTAQATNFHVERDWLSGYIFNPMYSGQVYYNFAKDPNATDPDTFNMGNIDGNPEYLDPAIDYETAGGEVLQNVYETLIWYNGSSADEFIPYLATNVPTLANGGVSADGMTYTFNIRENVTFHDGTPMTADDVKYSLTRLLMLNDPHGPAWMQGEVMIPDYYNYQPGTFDDDGNFIQVDDPANETYYIKLAMMDDCMWVKDDYTLQINLTQPFPAFLSTLAFNDASVVSQDFVEANGGLTKDGFDYMNTDLCGTGPYEFVEYVPSEYIKLVRNDNYWRTPASIKNVILWQVADDASRVTQLKAGDLDCAAVPRAMMQDVEDANGDPLEGLAITKGLPTFNIDFLGLNQNINRSASMNPEATDVPADFFADKNVRLAFAHAFDTDTYIENTLKGTAIQPNGVIPMGMFGYSADVPVYEYNLTKAGDFLKLADLPAAETGAHVSLVEIAAVVREL